MKANLEQVEVFTPFSLKITFESESEAAAFYSLFNHDTLIKATVSESFALHIRYELNKINISQEIKNFYFRKIVGITIDVP